jgi:hypothetical protein
VCGMSPPPLPPQGSKKLSYAQFCEALRGVAAARQLPYDTLVEQVGGGLILLVTAWYICCYQCELGSKR